MFFDFFNKMAEARQRRFAFRQDEAFSKHEKPQCSR
jgi:hypothetical protein